MKILAIHINNLASLEGETIIDFRTEPLSSAGIFAITGPTGAGKSTILDALCLALYAHTPRYEKSSDPNQSIQDIAGNQVTQSDPRSILRDGAGEGFAKVDFIGVDGDHYQSAWNVKRARSKAGGKLQAYVMSLKNITSNTDAQGTNREILIAIIRVVGLSFDQFTRAVLLAQGDFTAFLKAGNNDKADLLEKLTGTEIYSEISKRIFEHHRREKEELNVFQIQKQSINIISDEQLSILNNRIKELLTIQQDQKRNEETLAKELTWREQLNTLSQQLNQSKENYNLSAAAKEEAKPREIKLILLDQVQPARIWIQGLKTDGQLLNEKKERLKTLDSKIITLQGEKIAHDEIVKSLQLNLESKSKQRDDAVPLLDTAKKLDVKLSDSAAQLLIADNELKQAKEILEEHRKLLEQKNQKAEELKTSIKTLTAFVEKNQTRRPLADNHKLILLKLADAQKFQNAGKQANDSLQSINNSIVASTQEVTQKESALNELQASVKSLSEIYQQKANELKAIDISALKKSKTEADTQVIELGQAIADWKTLYEATQVIDSSKTTLAKNEKELGLLQKQFTKSEKELKTANVQKEAAYRSLEIAKIAATENVLALRGQLTEKNPCPVCGSLEHPYVVHDSQLNHILIKLEEDFKNQELRHNDILTQHSTLKEKIKQLEKDNAKLTKELILKENEITEHRENWTRFRRHADAENRPANEVGEWLKQQRNEQQVAQVKLNGQYSAWEKQQQDTEEQKKLHDQAIQQFQDADNSLKDIRRSLQSLQEKGKQAKGEYETSIKNLDEIKETIGQYFTDANWFEQWRTDAAAFTQAIDKFVSEWKTNTESLEKAKNEQGISAATIKGLEDQQLHLLVETSKKEQARLALDQQRVKLLGERNALFGGQAVELVEQNLKVAIDKASQDLEKQKLALDSLLTNITRFGTQKDEIKEELDRLNILIADHNANLTKWLTDHNSKHASALQLADLENLLAVTSDWIDTERKAIQQISNVFLQEQTMLQEHTAALQRHQEQKWPERDIEAVSNLLAEAKTAFQVSIKENTEIGLQLKQDSENRTRAGTLLQQIETKEEVVENWAKLNQVIGSADGKKFRQVAQEYTLDILLEYTNIQLQMLSMRYVLQRIPQSLGMQVIDQDMGNEIRTVNSLSGGESFLVSLALALGLASLSSTRMQVESLFIDEGFGSLDPNTLNMAMDALERLHNQGRKVGVISHVQEMTERIPVQIKVSKQNGGRSLVEVS